MEQVKVLKQNLDKANGVSEIIRKYVVSGNEKFVVFLKDTTHLRDMKPVIEKWFTDARFAVRMYEVHSKNVDKDKEFKAFKEDTEEGVKLCLSVNMLSEGLHGDISGVIMLRETMSPNLYFQMIGRAFSCGKKTIPLIFDLVANSQFISDAVDNFPNELKGEIEKRKEEYEKEGKDYEVGFNVDGVIVMDEFMDVVSGFKDIEGRIKGRVWTEEENEILREWYSIEGTKVIDRLSGRTKRAITKQAFKLGLKVYDVYDSWSDEEIELLKKYYLIEGCRVKERLNGGTERAIMTQARKLKLIRKKSNWTEDEKNIIKKYYIEEGINVYKRLPGRSKQACYIRAQILGVVKMEGGKKWTNDEDEILKNKYPIMGSKVAGDLNRTKYACVSRAKELGIKCSTGLNKHKYVEYRCGKWRVGFWVNGKRKNFGTYDSEDEAAKVAMQKAKEYGKAI